MLRTQSFGTVEVTSVDRDSLLAALQRGAAQLGRDFPEVEMVALFGSFARGDYTPESDVDLLLQVSDTEVPYLERPDRYRDAFAAIPLDVNLTVYTRDEAEGLRREAGGFLQRIEEGALVLYRRGA